MVQALCYYLIKVKTMEIIKTLKFLKSAKVAVIASENDNIFKDFINYISGSNDVELSVLHVLQYDCANNSTELNLTIANKISDIKRKYANCVLPIEFLNREKHYVTALLRSLYLRIPESEAQDVQLFNLYYFASELRLECEFGENAGWYVVYDYDAITGTFTEKE